MQRTRSIFKCPILGYTSDLKENILPTYIEVLKCYEWTRLQIKLEKETAREPTFMEVAEKVSFKIINIWQTTSIPTVTTKRVLQMLKNIHLKYKNLQKSIKRTPQEKLESFHQRCKLLFDIAACKCKDFYYCTCGKDKRVPSHEQAFLTDQRNKRMMAIGKTDFINTKKIQKTLERKYREKKRATEFLSTSAPSVLDLSSSSPSTSSENSKSSLILKKKIVKDLKKKEIKKEDIRSVTLPTLSQTCERYGVSDRAAAAISSSILLDIKSEVGVIDRHKIRRERTKVKETLSNYNSISELFALYFDGRKDKTVQLKKRDRKIYKTLITEEHISLLQEPGSFYLGYVVPDSGSAKGIQTSIRNFLSDEGIPQHNLLAIGCDGTNVNTGKHGGVIKQLEAELHKPLQWIICLLHLNELPLRHLFQYIDGCTSGPKSYTGPLGKALENCENLPITNFRSIKGNFLPEMARDLSSDQLYLHKIVSAVLSGEVPQDLANKSPGKMSHARWLTRANRIMRLYVATEIPSENLLTLAKFVVKVYAPSWFSIKNKPFCKNGPLHLFDMILASRYLPLELKNIIDPVIQRNAYFAHPENILLAMITDKNKHIRELGVRRILKVRNMPHGSKPRMFEVPAINFNAATYYDLINWQGKLTEPPLLRNLSDQEIRSFVESGDVTEAPFLRLPCHTQAVERAVKMTTEAAISNYSHKSRLGAIRAKIESRKTMPVFETKRDFKAFS